MQCRAKERVAKIVESVISNTPRENIPGIHAATSCEGKEAGKDIKLLRYSFPKILHVKSETIYSLLKVPFLED